MNNIFRKTISAGFVLAAVLFVALGAAGQRKLPKSENPDIAPVEVVQVLELPVSLSDVVLRNTERGYVLKCSISNNLGTPIVGMDYLLLVIDANNSKEAIISVSEKLQIKAYGTKDLVSKTAFGLNVTQGYRLILLPNRVFDGESIWEVPKAGAVLEAFAAGDYSVTPRATQVTNLVDTPIGSARVID